MEITFPYNHSSIHIQHLIDLLCLRNSLPIYNTVQLQNLAHAIESYRKSRPLPASEPNHLPWVKLSNLEVISHLINARVQSMCQFSSSITEIYQRVYEYLMKVIMMPIILEPSGPAEVNTGHLIEFLIEWSVKVL